jgi:hypothetical protein
MLRIPHLFRPHWPYKVLLASLLERNSTLNEAKFFEGAQQSSNLGKLTDDFNKTRFWDAALEEEKEEEEEEREEEERINSIQNNGHVYCKTSSSEKASLFCLYTNGLSKVRSSVWVNVAESRNFLTIFSECLLCAI